MADFDLSMVIRGDGSSAAAAADQVENGLEKVASANKSAGAEAGKVSKAFLDQEIAQRKVASAAAALDVAQTRVADSAVKGAAEQRAAATALARAEAAYLSAGKAQLKLNDGLKEGAKSSAAAAFGARNLGQQFGDLGLSIAGGISPARAFGQQAGQIGYALSEMGGRAGKVGAFLTGPWGIALTIGAAVLAPYVEKLFEGSKAAEELLENTTKAATAADSFGSAQSLLGKVLDLTTGKLKTQNLVLIESIRLQALAGIAKARADDREAREDLLAAGNPGLARRVSNGIGASSPGPIGAIVGAISGGFGGAGSGVDPRLNAIAAQFNAGQINITEARKKVDALGLSAEKSAEALLKFIRVGTNANDITANQDVIDALDGKGVDKALVPYKRDPKPKKPKKPKIDTVTPREAEEIARINEEFDRTPTLIDKAAQSTRRLDAIIADLTKRKPPGFEKLIADAEKAKVTIQEGLQRPYQDFIRDQQQALDVQRLLTAGRVDEANALKTVQSLQATMGPLTNEQRDAILATTQAISAQGRALQVVQAENAKYVDAVASVKGIVQDATRDIGSLAKAPGRLLDAFKTFQGRKLFDSLFGETFRDLEAQATGTSVVKDASDRMATAVDKASASIIRLGNAADQAAGGVAGAGAAGAAGAAAGGTATDAAGDIVVNGRRNPIVSSIGKLGEKLGGLVGLKDPKAFGAQVGKFAGKGLEGAATGSVVAGVSKALGIKMSGTGAQIGGAIGNFIPIPGGAIIGSIAGGLLGGLFGKTKTGSASISNAGGEASISGTSGNSASYRKAASGLAGTVIDGINSVVDALGGSLGDFSVSVGQRKGKFAVDSSGGGRTKVSGSGGRVAVYDTAEEAAAAALANAIADGAVKGISAAMQRALQGNSDVERGVKEALKVKEVEALIGGLGSALKSQFDAFDTLASDRVNTARKYGLDILAVEKINAEQRAKLVDDTLKSRIGSLSDFLNNLKFGDLAEGTAVDKRNALLEQIRGVQADAEAGKDGAADQLAGLYSQLVSSSRDAFGTAGVEYGTDRNSAQSAVERVIQMETDRVNQAAGITAAAQATTTAVEAGNALASEANDLIAQQTAEFRNMSALLTSKLGYGGGGGFDYGITSRYANLALA